MNGIQVIYLYKCSSLITLPDLSKWNTENIKNITGMLNGCSSLISLPDISKWDLKIGIIDSIFNGCSSLISIPELIYSDISIFNNCFSLLNMPKISESIQIENIQPNNYIHNPDPTNTELEIDEEIDNNYIQNNEEEEEENDYPN